ncbi:MAG TPA: polymer-forming cytoskeletal protein [Alphaproteobacteria bacterium]|nr:polymer-forming cytoskeletal protein [Alphaproteobacteria bacterium]
MSIFGRSENTKRNSGTRPSVRPLPIEQSDDVKLLTPEASTRRNVPAVAMGQPRRTTMALPMPSGMQRNEMSVGEKRLIVGRDISLAGEIADCDQLVVEGSMDATLRAGKRLDIYQTGVFRGAANVQEADIAGTFAGELNVAGRLRLRATSQVSGTIRYSEIEVEAGAQLSGEFQYVAGSVNTAANDTDGDIYPYNSAANG